MDAVQLARGLADGGRVNQLGTPGDATHTFRVHSSTGPYILKIYDKESYARREERSFAVLAGAPGTPVILERGDTEGTQWVKFADPGAWTMATLPENAEAARSCGAIVRSIHQLDTANVTNLHGGMTADQVAADYQSTFQRLSRFRGRLNMGAHVIDAAVAIPPPRCSAPTFSHTNPSATNFFVNDESEVTLFDWTWATLTPPEWDFSLAYWSLGASVGTRASTAFAEGYGAALSDEDLRPWIVYHIASYLIRVAETSSGRLEHLRPSVDQLTAFAML
ncbi:MAG: aminoglycoside phosphotransferase family protein [Acidimicrobiia bacterium]|nr:aminoglycoside phosphotransferase family protein [Acidimicrobiia bacterium]